MIRVDIYRQVFRDALTYFIFKAEGVLIEDVEEVNNAFVRYVNHYQRYLDLVIRGRKEFHVPIMGRNMLISKIPDVDSTMDIVENKEAIFRRIEG